MIKQAFGEFWLVLALIFIGQCPQLNFLHLFRLFLWIVYLLKVNNCFFHLKLTQEPFLMSISKSEAKKYQELTQQLIPQSGTKSSSLGTKLGALNVGASKNQGQFFKKEAGLKKFQISFFLIISVLWSRFAFKEFQNLKIKKNCFIFWPFGTSLWQL